MIKIDSLKKVNEVIALSKQAIKERHEMELKEAEHRGWMAGFKAAHTQAIQFHCPHNPEDVETAFSEDEQFAFCTKCGKDLTDTFTENSQLPV